jgi:CRP-like cAMP-binding protein
VSTEPHARIDDALLVGGDTEGRQRTAPRASPRQEGLATDEANHLLSQIAADRPQRYTSLMAEAERVPFGLQFTFHQPGNAVRHVYFLETGVIAIVARSTSGREVTTAIIGREGMTGLSACLGATSIDMTHCTCVPGIATRVSVASFRAVVLEDVRLAERVLRYTRYAAMQIAQSTACNALHATTRRCARWLLMIRDRVGAQTFPLPLQHVASLLGTRLQGAAVATKSLRASGLIRYSQGEMTVLDSSGLEAAACECLAADRRCVAELVGAAP